MMDSVRLERVLISVAMKYAPTLVPMGWQRAGDYQRLTRKSFTDLTRELACEGALVFFADVPPSLGQHADLVLKDWVEQWVRLHNLFADSLFPTFRQTDAYVLDRQPPRPVLIVANAMPVLSALAELTIPFVAHMNSTRPVDRVLRDVVCAMLVHMESATCALPLSERLQAQGAVLLRLLLDSPIRPYTAIPYVPGQTLPDRLPQLDDSERIEVLESETLSMSVTGIDQITPLPPTMPELDTTPPTAPPDTAAPAPKASGMPPIPFGGGGSGLRSTGEVRRPPVPPLPKK